ncbi:Hypothetical protein DEACI_1315 [Acididesulfobacillus acetoxydans]|uniref:Uncharacterized protein n=1 Tax=Acididesulfobacillus acetoxydans TaxID=1561005 RepID=A0A8S0WF46_9FIRM|nr:hypothetical protein [Acididesulfobacillus acetoxydans]CAA7600662.1 Hypothetical protein DEACI_1315 [Acididesulfobacillus acetoxydans]CEJ09443.1 Hypothetical protein DEACI_3927 [Acididesulfobacillus acetoxydans]
MRWSERLKLTWQTFLRGAPALYLWFLIYVLLMAVVIVIFVFSLFHQAPTAIPSSAFLHRAPMFPGPYAPFPGGSLHGNFTYGGPMPFGPFGPFGAGLPFLQDPALVRPFLGRLAWSLLGLIIISLFTSAGFTAGTYQLTHKAFKGERPSFRDFRLRGTWRILGWNILLFLAQLIVAAIAVLGALLFHRIKILLALFLVVYLIALAALVIYLIPWLGTAKVYLLARREHSFWHTLRESFTFFRRHMAALWGYIGTALLILVVLLVLNRILPLLDVLVSLAITPFNMVLPMIWVLSLLKEEAGGSPADYGAPAAQAPVLSRSGEPGRLVSESTSTPNTLDTPNTQDVSDTSHTPDTPDTPATSDIPETPGTANQNPPRNPSTLNATDMPNTSSNPDTPTP